MKKGKGIVLALGIVGGIVLAGGLGLKLFSKADVVAPKVVAVYQSIEDNVVGTFQEISDDFVEKYIAKDGETVEESKERLSEEQKEREAKRENIRENISTKRGNVVINGNFNIS